MSFIYPFDHFNKNSFENNSFYNNLFKIVGIYFEKSFSLFTSKNMYCKFKSVSS